MCRSLELLKALEIVNEFNLQIHDAIEKVDDYVLNQIEENMKKGNTWCSGIGHIKWCDKCLMTDNYNNGYYICDGIQISESKSIIMGLRLISAFKVIKESLKEKIRDN